MIELEGGGGRRDELNQDGREMVATAGAGGGDGVGGGYVTERRAEENQDSAAETHPMFRLPRTPLGAADK